MGTRLASRGESGLHQLQEARWAAPVEEGFRLLAINVVQLAAADGKTARGAAVVVLSAFPGEGRSRVAAGLARALAELGHDVTLIDADLGGSGFAHLLAEEGPFGGGSWPPFGDGAEAANLTVLVPDRQQPGSRLEHLLEVQSAMEAGVGRREFAIVDAPACTVSSDGFFLAARGTGVVYVAGQREAAGAIHADIRGQLDLQGARVLGVVLNEP